MPVHTPILRSIILFLALWFANTAASSAETLTVSFSTTSAGGQYAPKNIDAVWIETQAGAFVKTIGDWSKSERKLLTAWRAKAGTSDTDAIMGATRTTHTGTLTLTWNMLPRGGTTAVADGTYVVRFEMLDDKAHRTGVTFDKNGSASTVGPISQGGFNNITLTYSGRLGAAPAISSPGTASGSTGMAFTYTIAGSNAPTSFSATGLPAGLAVNTTTGVISGTPTAAGTSVITLGATNASGTGNLTLTLTITTKPTITSGTTASGTVGAAFSYAITASNAPTSFSATGLPAGLAVNAGTGVISGTPTTAATSLITVGATNAGGTGSTTLTLTIANPIAGAPVITSGGTASGALNVAFTYTIIASNAPTSYSASGLPSGLSVNGSTGSITGTPTSAGTFTATVSATNGAGTGNASLHLTIAGVPVISSSATASGARNTAFSYTITASDNPTSYSASGLPAGLSVNTSSGVISGTPTTVGIASVTLQAGNAAGTGTRILTLTINGAPAVTSSLTDAASTGSTYNYQIIASNNPTSYSASGLPTGLNVNTGNGMISGTPGTPGIVTITLAATNASGTGTATLTLTISDGGGGSSQTTAQAARCGYGTGYSTLLLLLLAGVLSLRLRTGRPPVGE